MPSFHEVTGPQGGPQSGQHRSLGILQAFLRKKAVPQALLFQGAEGVGKKEIAESFAQTILCRTPSSSAPNSADLEPCGACIACRKMKSQNHPDFSVIEPDGTRIKIGQIRDIQQKIFFKPIDGPNKIILIDPADKMNDAAANSLLKMLEEPPSYAIFILISSKADSLLPTLLSRCQKISFQPLSLSEVVSRVMEKKACGKEAAQLISAVANGHLREALSLELQEAQALEAARYCLISSEDFFQTALDFSGNSEIFQQALSYLTTWFRDVLVLKSLPDSEAVDLSLIVFSWRYDALKEWAASVEAQVIWHLLADLQAIHLAQNRNVNRQLSLETILLEIRKQRFRNKALPRD